MLDLVGRDAGDDVVAVGEEETDEADLEWREGRGYEPGPGRVVGCLECALACMRILAWDITMGLDTAGFAVRWVALTE